MAQKVAAGLTKGIWDIHLPHPRGIYKGLWIEMKWGDNDLTKEQKEFRKDNPQFCYAVAYSWQEAWNAAITYLGIKYAEFLLT